MHDAGNLLWLAGLLEGEGCFFHGTYHYPPRPPLTHVWVEVCMSDRDVVERAAAIMGARVTSPRRRSTLTETPKQMWRAAVTGDRAVALMQDLRPHMGGRRTAKIDECTEAWANRPRVRAA